MSNLELVLMAVAFLIPVTGFILMLNHARDADSLEESRWRKSHGIVYWVLIPGIIGFVIILSLIGVLPRLFALLGIIALALSTTLSMSLQKKREKE